MTINDAMNSALSGMQAASTMFNVAASNIANLNSTGYKPVRIDLSSAPAFGGGVSSSIAADSYQGSIGSPADSSGDSSGDDDSDQDLTNDIVQMSTAQNLYDANAAVIRTSNQMIGSLLDVVSDGSQGYRDGYDNTDN